MALTTTGINTVIVGNAIGNSSRAYTVLCTAPTVNPFSKARPGLWNLSTSPVTLTFIKPDGVTVDPRGINPETNTSHLSARIGDFRGYNHTAIIPGLNNIPVHNFDPAVAATAQTVYITINIGEMNWANVPPFRTQNAFGVVTYAYIINDTDNTVIGSVDISALADNSQATISGSFIAPNEGLTTNIPIRVEMGDSTSPNFRLGTYGGMKGTGTLTLHTYANPIINVTSTGFSITGQSSTAYTNSYDINYAFTTVDAGDLVTTYWRVLRNGVTEGTGNYITRDGTAYSKVFTLSTYPQYDDIFSVQLQATPF